MKRRQFLQAGALAAVAVGAPPGAVAQAAPTHEARPVPDARQLQWQREELAMFVHFTINTFTGREWGDGREDPRVFQPTQLDARQWARTAKAAGFGSLILTAKHHDGFCLWPTATTEHSVRQSNWRNGGGDVVREFVDGCRDEGLGAGFYLSPWDRHESRYGTGEPYNDFYIAQLTELLTRYGPVVEVWFDGANGEGPDGRRQQYDWPRIHRTVRELQPKAVIFSDAGPDVRWIGNERGAAGTTCWSTVDPARVPHAGFDRPWIGDLLGQGDPYGTVWRPGETDVSIRPGWFWHPEEDARVRSPEDLLDLYFRSVGRNSKLLLNVPPTRDGLFHSTDVQALTEFGRKREALFAGGDLLRSASVRASSQQGTHVARNVVDGEPETYWAADATTGWLELILPEEIEFDLLDLQEAIAHGQSIAAYRVDRWTGDGWMPLTWGTTVGYRKLERFDPIRTSRLRFHIEHAYVPAKLARIAAYRS